MTTRTTHEMDLTQGKVPSVLLRFALPFLLANVLQALYGGADLFVVGHSSTMPPAWPAWP